MDEMWGEGLKGGKSVRESGEEKRWMKRRLTRGKEWVREIE